MSIEPSAPNSSFLESPIGTTSPLCLGVIRAMPSLTGLVSLRLGVSTNIASLTGLAPDGAGDWICGLVRGELENKRKRIGGERGAQRMIECGGEYHVIALLLRSLHRGKAASSLRSAARTYSTSKVIHGWRGLTPDRSPQPTVNNFGPVVMHPVCEQFKFWLNQRVEHAGPGRRTAHSNGLTFLWRCSLRVLRLIVKEHSEPFACKCEPPAETNFYKSFDPVGPRA